MKNILFVSSECYPFIKTGGLADVVGSLPKYFNKKYYDVRIILPLYAAIKEEYKEKMVYLKNFYFDYAGQDRYVGLFDLEMDGIKYYFIDNQEYFGASKPYTNNFEDIIKFIFFDKAVLSSLPNLNFRPDIIHCHDWQTGLIPIYLRSFFLSNPYYHSIKSIMTIHNLKFQGVQNKEMIQYYSSLDDWYFEDDRLGFNDNKDGNMLKGGLVFADAITTVSPSYAEEIKTPLYGEYLDYLMRRRSKDLRGILNGLDYNDVNPESDSKINKNYNIDNAIDGKQENKIIMQQKLGLPVDKNKMMIGIVSRLTDQKGFDLILTIFEKLCHYDIQLIVLGTGEKDYENSFKYFEWKYPNKVKACIYYSEEMSRQIYAASDAFLMPSLFEPCGLSQLFALRYGSLPIVRETGGLKDTVQPYNYVTNTGNGFSFANYSSEELFKTCEVAIGLYYDYRDNYNKMIKRAMSCDFSWSQQVLKYQEMYDWLLNS